MSLMLHNSPGSSQSSLTLGMESMSLGRGRGRPRKQLTDPSYDGYPVDGSEEEIKRWLKMNATEQWQYNIFFQSSS